LSDHELLLVPQTFNPSLDFEGAMTAERIPQRDDWPNVASVRIKPKQT